MHQYGSLMQMSQPSTHHCRACARRSRNARPVPVQTSRLTVPDSRELGFGTRFEFLFEVVGGKGEIVIQSVGISLALANVV